MASLLAVNSQFQTVQPPIPGLKEILPSWLKACDSEVGLLASLETDREPRQTENKKRMLITIIMGDPCWTAGKIPKSAEQLFSIMGALLLSLLSSFGSVVNWSGVDIFPSKRNHSRISELQTKNLYTSLPLTTKLVIPPFQPWSVIRGPLPFWDLPLRLHIHVWA